MNKIFTLALFLIIFVKGYAAVETYTSGIVLPITTGVVIDHADGQYFNMANNAFWENDFTNYKVTNYVKIGYVPDQFPTVTSSVEVEVEVTYWTYAGFNLFTQNTATRTLTLDFDANGYLAMTDLSAFTFEDAHRIQVEVLSITGNPADVFIESGIEVERYYTMNSYSTVASGIGVSGPNAENITFYWNPTVGAEEYELEWTFISDYDFTIDPPTVETVSPLLLKYNFYRNSTRVKVKQLYYEIPALFNRGYVLYRVRPIGRQGADFEYRLEGDWSLAESGDVFNAPADSKLYVSSDFEQGKNWSHIISYTEEGRRFEGVSYQDGLGRGRQSVSHNSVKDQVVINNVYYDIAGRPTVVDLPTPETSESFAYRTSFNLLSLGLDPVTPEGLENQFDPCVGSPVALDQNTGAGKYYSQSNLGTNTANAFIPDANGYPYMKIQYLDDPTGRMDKVGLFGEEHQIGNHATEYKYATPGQVELNELFGSEVGYKQHYQKEYVVDPNGQASATYFDLAGRVVATNLVGSGSILLDDVPTNVPVLSSEQTVYDGSQTPNGDSSPEPEISTYSYVKTVIDAQDVTFIHTFDPAVFEDNCLPPNFCFDCVYEFTFEITDLDCDQPVIPTPIVQTINGGQINAICDGLGYSGTSVTVTLPAGSYMITKTLSVSATAAYDYWCLYASNYNCLKQYSEYYTEFYDEADFGCETYELDTPPDAICDAKRSLMASHMAVGGQYGETDAIAFPTEFELSIYNENNQLPTGNTWRNPVGNYTNSDGTDALIYVNWISGAWSPAPLPGATIYTDAGGDSYIYPQDLANLSDFVYYAVPEWGDALVEYHPEYCYLQYCYQSSDYLTYTQLLDETQTFDAACSNGLFSPLATQTSPTTAPPVSNISSFTGCNLTGASNTYDDFFISGYYSTIAQWAIDNYRDCLPNLSYNTTDDLVSYYTLEDLSGTLSIWEYAVWQVSCADLTSYNDIITCVNSTVLDDCNKDMVWMIYREAYQELREQLYLFGQAAYISYPANLLGGGCGPTNNECIGNNSFTSFSMIQGCLDPYKHKDITDINNDGIFSTGISASTQGPCSNPTEDLYANMQPLFWNGTSQDTPPANVSTFVQDQIDAMCDLNCESMADGWMQKLEGCDLTQAQFDAIRIGLIQVCADGCDLDNVFGSSTVAVPGTGVYDSFEEVLAGVLGSNYQSEICSEFLISQPKPYNQNLQNTLVANLDECGCDKVLQAEYDLINNPVAGIATIQEMLMYTEGINYAYAHRLACACNEAFGSSPAWTPSATWSASSLQMLSDSPIKVPTALSCNGVPCKTCAEVDAAYAQFVIKFGANIDQLENYEILMTNYLNIALGVNQTLDQYENFMLACGSTSSEPNFSLTNVAPVFKDMLNVIVQKGQLLSDQANAIDLQSQNIVFEISNISTLFDGSDYWSCAGACIPADELVLSFGNQSGTPSQLTLRLPAGADFDFSDIRSIEEISPVPSCSSNNEFSLVVSVQTCGNLETCIITGESNDLILTTSYCGANPNLKLCSEFEGFIPGDNCYKPTLIAISNLAKDAFMEKMLMNQSDFVADYMAQCATGLDTELLKEVSQENSYQHTLFYYDQAGNLVKTVAPKGFHDAYVSTNAFSTMEAATGSDVPSHKYTTTYQYNSYNQLVSTTNPDQEGVTTFWYDFYGRIVASQNPVQFDENKYSYTKYDVYGRPVLVGQVVTSVPLTDLITKVDDLGSAFESWVNNGVSSEVTVTIYDASLGPFIDAMFASGQQENLRLRVASVLYYPDLSGGLGGYESAIHYSYDQHGNVIEQIQDVPLMASVDQQLKSTQYDFELISGLVTEVKYQEGERDYLSHLYLYDEMNRLTELHTTIDDVHFTRQVHYSYYDYGPLARTELGQHKVQGCDFAYTPNGWLKGMNSSLLDVNKDMGADGIAGYDIFNPIIHQNMARDVLAYTLGYYNDDYHPIDATKSPELSYSGSLFDTDGREQFNGNIRNTITSIFGLQTMANAYHFDQLYRLTSMQGYYESGGVLTATNHYANSYEYDANGNIEHLVRSGPGSQLAMDDMTYTYGVTLNGGNPSNRLADVQDAVVPNTGFGDIQNGMTPGNFGYDKIGQLTSDPSEEILSIDWRSGDKKMLSIERSSGSNKSEMEFIYNPFGQRVVKITKPRTGGVPSNQAEWIYTYYSYDANGQVMAVYDVTLGQDEIATLNEQHIYGTSRIGMLKPAMLLYDNGQALPPTSDVYQNVLGQTYYEITNHLGNVNVVINDRKMVSPGGSPSMFEAVVIQNADYYPGGMVMPERHIEYAPTNADYRYAYNGMETDNEVSGNGNSYTTEFRQYDPRLMRWKSLDPLMAIQPHQSPYQAFNNNPIYFTDPYGLIGGPAQNYPGYGNINTDGWYVTPKKTREYTGVGGMLLNIPTNGKTITPFSDYNRDGFIGNPNTGVSYKNVSKGQVYSFYGNDNQLYTARFDKDGHFTGYKNSESNSYDNRKINSDKDILDIKLQQAFEYFGNGQDSEEPPTYDGDHNFSLNGSFSIGGKEFKGDVHARWFAYEYGGGKSKRDRHMAYLTFSDKRRTIAGGFSNDGSPNGFKVVIFNSGSSPSYARTRLIEITFYDVMEYTRFLNYVIHTYNINDECVNTDDAVPMRSATPTELMKIFERYFRELPQSEKIIKIGD